MLLDTKNGDDFIREGEPFKVAITFSKPPVAVQVVDFSWCSPPPEGLTWLTCETMEPNPVYGTEQQENVFTVVFEDGVSNPPDKADRFDFSVVWAGSEKEYRYGDRIWWKRDLGQIMLSEQ